MYLIVALLFFIIGIILLITAHKIVKENLKITFIRLIGFILIILSVIAIYMLLSGIIILPLSKS